ncbi:hypothetical protein LTR84_012010 [Exophiala bonariae]|uniref:HypA protein n=1 Tax=Exophiala bonariae TaxID=1690606 RepID=A0AAV9MUA8_9EURO|nr:hypothetical protein LTR84_012010 [Exophiala bonariae]
MAEFPINLKHSGVYHVPEITHCAIEKVASLLQQNHEEFHVYWNFKGYHNHQVHYLLTAFALGADPSELQTAFDINTGYQRPRLPLDEELIEKLSDRRYFKSLLGYDAWFNDYTTFFKRKFELEGWQNVVNEYLFSGSDIADELLVRLFSGVLHPLIHFGFGIEFQQPAIIAEGLAQAVCHSAFFKPFLLASERLAQTQRKEDSSSLVDLLSEIRQDADLYDEAYWDGGDSLNEKIVADAPEKLCAIAAKWRVSVEEIEVKTAEIVNATAWMTGAAQRLGKTIKLDFFFIHSVNASIFLTAFNKQSWLSAENKARLLEWKGRIDLLNYASRLAPELHPEEITKYTPLQKLLTWPLLIEKTNRLTHDDGHIAKLIRTLAHGQGICQAYEACPETAAKFPLKSQGWIQIANMAIDTTTETRTPDRWVRGAGGAKNWEKFADRG